MQVLVATLTDVALDWAVAKVIGEYKPVPVPTYSTNWSQGGPIIEREHICLNSWYERWDACASHGKTAAQRWSGPTPLIAAMRCFVASKLGDLIEIPEELQ